MHIVRQLLFGFLIFASVVTPVTAAPIHFVTALAEDVDVTELEVKFAKAMKLMGSSCDASDVDIKLIEYGQYKYLSGLINYYTNRPLAGSVTIVPSDFDDTKWKLMFADQNMDVVSLVIDGKPKTLRIEGDDVGGKGDSEKDLWLRTAGEYNLSLPKGFTPESFVIKAINIETGEEEEIPGTWPKQGRYCLIKIANHCVDNMDRLAAILQDENAIGEPIYLSDVKESVQLFHAAIGDTVGKAKDIWTDQGVRITIPRPEGRNPKRVWMAYPLTLNESQTRLATLKNPDGTFKKGTDISQIIRDQGVITKGNLGPNVRPLYVAESNAGKWYEMPEYDVARQEYYEAIWQISDRDKLHWQNEWKGKNYRLYVFEFEYPDGDKEIVSVTHPDTGKKVRAVDEEWNWLTE